MSGAAAIQFTGALGRDPELRFTPSGAAVCSLSVAVSERRLSSGGQWEDASVSWFTVTCWRQLAENVAASLRKGDRVTVTGSMIQRSYEKDDQKRYAWDVKADDIAASLKFAGASIRRAAREHEVAAEPEPWQPAAEPADEDAALAALEDAGLVQEPQLHAVGA